MYFPKFNQKIVDVYALELNKNTRTLGAGDYPALKFFFILKVHEKDNFWLSFTIEVCSQAQTRALRDLTDLTIDQTRASKTFHFAWHSIIVIIVSSRELRYS